MSLVESDAQVFQSATDHVGLKLWLVGSEMTLVRVKKPGVESAVIEIQSAMAGIQSDERGFQAAAWLLRLAACKYPQGPRNVPSVVPGCLFAGAGGAKVMTGFRASHVISTVKSTNRRRDIFGRSSFSPAAHGAMLRLPTNR
ncbi:MAG TPA: hypothetical protein VF765_19300 [Polyangiaceae bacterium]